MPCRTRMKILLLQGVLWLCLLNFGFVLSILDPGYLDFDNLPDTNFSCVGKVIGGYYADLETNCQMFHVCTIGQLDEPMDIRFLCLNGTVFDQETRVCERVDEVDCSKSEKFYHLNLELYGNTAPPIVEEPDPTEAPLKSYTTTTTPRPTTTTTKRTTRGTYYTTQPIPTIPPTTHSTPKVITSNQFPVNSGPDIRFNPEEINIRLTPGSPPIIKSPSISYQQTAYNGGDSRITVTTHTPNYNDPRTAQVLTQRSVPLVSSTSSTQKPKSIVSYGLTHTNQQTYQPQQSYEYSYHTDNPDLDYHTDLPSSEYYHDNSNVFESKQLYSASTTKRSETNYGSSTSFPSSHKPSQGYNYQRTDKPLSVQLPLPLFPTLPPLTFSSPAPFTLQRHYEKKRSNDHQQHPRIVVSASASVSDASGRRLNYSLGTIGTSYLIGQAPKSYDDYKEGDVGLDPFYHDVPRVNRKRRDTSEEETNTAKEEISTEEHTTHWIPPDYVDDNYEPLTYNVPENETTIENNNHTKNATQSEEIEYEYYDYVDDNFEPVAYRTDENDVLDIQKPIDTTSVPSKTVTDIYTESPFDDVILNSTIEFNTLTEGTNYDSENSTESITTKVEDNTTTVPTTLADDSILNLETELPTMANRSEIDNELSEIENVETTTDPSNIEYQTTENILTTIPSVTESVFISTTVESMTDPYESTTTLNVEDSNEYTTNVSSENFSDYTITTQNPETTTEYLDYTTVNSETTLVDNIEPETTTAPSITESYTTTDNIAETTTLSEDVNTSIEEKYQETTTMMVPITSTTEVPSSSTTRYSYLRTREPAYKRNSRTRPTTRHRFSSPSIHMSQSLLKLQRNKMVTPKPSNEAPNFNENRFVGRLNNNILESKSTTNSYEVLSKSTSSNEASNFDDDQFVNQFNHIVPDVKSTSAYEEMLITDAPLSKSANPTEPKITKSSAIVPTTPISKTFFIPRRFTYDTTRSFNCFGKQLNKFYEDPRDCRLFHYCTPGYTETQVLDMKFVCDYGTYFDSDKLICAKMRPQRCK